VSQRGGGVTDLIGWGVPAVMDGMCNGCDGWDV
jgi:hypothetical protein